MQKYKIEVKVYDKLVISETVRPGRFRYSLVYEVEAQSLSRARKLAKRMTGIRDKYLMPILVNNAHAA